MYISNINLTYVQKIEEAAEKGELTELVLMIIWNRLDLARKDVWAVLTVSFVLNCLYHYKKTWFFYCHDMKLLILFLAPLIL